METHRVSARLPRACSRESLAKRRRQHKATQPPLLTRAQLDGRTSAAKAFDKLVADIEADLGGRDQLSTIQLVLIEAFAGAAVTLQHLNTRLALGQEIASVVRPSTGCASCGASPVVALARAAWRPRSRSSSRYSGSIGSRPARKACALCLPERSTKPA